MAWCHKATCHYLNQLLNKFYEVLWCHVTSLSHSEFLCTRHKNCVREYTECPIEQPHIIILLCFCGCRITMVMWFTEPYSRYKHTLSRENLCCRLWNAKAEKNQDIENHTKTTVLNQENNIFDPRLLTLQQEILIHVQDVVNTCVKMEIYMQE